ncbi:glycosyltransferase family 39 protein [Streptomyces sp. NPDC091215]|uniref:glycosyltransferase family 39 protein n=1 Tax=Streptomyces sp. NPDC091215 TaxID=3155192 RepID=UPI003431F2CE
MHRGRDHRAVDRDSNPDTLLVLLLVSAACTLTRALRAEGRPALYRLCATGFLIGCGFLTKMLAAWMVIPAFVAAWLVGAPGTWAVRLGRLAAATAVLLVSSLWWVAMVALWPGDHPCIGGSEDGSAWNLVVGYNGFGRIFGSSDGSFQMGGAFGGEAVPDGPSTTRSRDRSAGCCRPAPCCSPSRWRGRCCAAGAVWTIAEGHRGRLELDTAPGRGCTFRLVVPAA